MFRLWQALENGYRSILVQELQVVRFWRTLNRDAASPVIVNGFIRVCALADSCRVLTQNRLPWFPVA